MLGDAGADDGEPIVAPEWTAAQDDGDSLDPSPESSTESKRGTTASDAPIEFGSQIEPVRQDVPRPPRDRLPPTDDSRFVAHEWGTFTSVVASNGEYLPGLHHEGVALPAFVHDLRYSGPANFRNADARGPSLPAKVTQKLETPVIYFYTDRPLDVRVQVGFPKGFITEWFPDSVSRTPTQPECIECSESVLEQHNFDELVDGRMTWDVSITHEDKSSTMTEVPPEDIWAPSRDVPDAAFVQHERETDKFIFYRGVGRATLPFKITAEKTGEGPAFTFENHSPQRVPNVYLMNITEDRGRITKVSSVAAGGSKTLNPAPKEMPKDEFVEHAKGIVKEGLIETGLTAEESEAMVETWAHSYFRKTGYRVLYILPRAWTDRLLPIDIEPKPDRLVRTIVGRVEVMTPGVEQKTLQRIRRAFAENRRLENVYRGGRFEEPHFRRACQLATDSDLQSWCERELRKLSSEVISEDGRSGY